jgi:hypothetical protein
VARPRDGRVRHRAGIRPRADGPRPARPRAEAERGLVGLLHGARPAARGLRVRGDDRPRGWARRRTPGGRRPPARGPRAFSSSPSSPSWARRRPLSGSGTSTRRGATSSPSTTSTATSASSARGRSSRATDSTACRRLSGVSR